MRVDVKGLNALLKHRDGGADTICKICGSRAIPYDVVDFQKTCSNHLYAHGFSGVSIYYKKCVECDFVFTEDMDRWTGKDFARHIYNDEYVLADPEYTGSRPARIAAFVGRMLAGHEQTRILDYGAGEGGLETHLRDVGFSHLAKYDPFSHPIRPEGRFDLVFASEVVEHSSDPLQTFSDMMRFADEGGIVLFTTLTQPTDIDQYRANWWYISPRNGHISIFSLKSLHRIASKFGCLLYQHGGSLILARSPDHIRALGIDAFQHRSIDLRAPAQEDPAWHAREAVRGEFARWIAARTVHWSIPGAPLRTRLSIRLPFFIPAGPAVADGHQLKVNGSVVESVANLPARLISASADVAPSETLEIELTLNALVGPEQRGGGDKRELGLLVPMAAG